MLEVHRAATQRREVAEEEAREEAFFKRYLEFCRAHVSPRLSEPAAHSLVSQYVELREQVGQLLCFWCSEQAGCKAGVM